MDPEDSAKLKPGDPIEWFHKRGGWRPATFLELMPHKGSVRILTELGCEIYRKLEAVRPRPTHSPDSTSD